MLMLSLNLKILKNDSLNSCFLKLFFFDIFILLAYHSIEQS